MQNCSPQISECIEKIGDYIIEKMPKGVLESIVLIGSFSKDEGSVYLNKENKLIALSDIEFIIILKNNADYRRLKNKAVQLSMDISQAMREKGIDIEIDLGFSLNGFLKRMEPCAFTYELKNYGKVIWGNQGILEIIPDYQKEKVKKEESIKVIFNRGIEQLKEVFGDRKDDMKTQTYQICKGYSNLASTLLMASGKYEPQYRKMAAGLEQIDINRFNGLKEKINKWLDFKLNPKEDLLFKNREEVLDEWERLRRYYKEIWLDISVSKYQSVKVPEIEKLAKIYFKKEELKGKIKGWGKLLLCQNGYGNVALLRALRLILNGSPKLLTWLCGMIVYLNYVSTEDKVHKTDSRKQNTEDFIKKCVPIIPGEYRNKELNWKDLRKIVIYNWEKFAKK